MDKMSLERLKYDALVQQIGGLLHSGRTQVAQSVNTILVRTYWSVGRHIVEYE